MLWWRLVPPFLLPVCFSLLPSSWGLLLLPGDRTLHRRQHQLQRHTSQFPSFPGSTAATMSSSSNTDVSAVNVHVISDFACPWCYVGKARLKSAVDAFERDNPDVRVSVSFGPYMIDPATQPTGEEYQAYNRRRWGGDGWTNSLKRSSLKDGCKFLKWITWPNSLLAHRLQQFAEATGKANEVNSLIFQTIYERGGNASDLETLVAVAAEVGLSAPDARAYLSSQDGENAVKEQDRHAKRDLGVGGVPYFVVSKGNVGSTTGSEACVGKGDSIVLEGAVGPDALLRAFAAAGATTSRRG